MERGKVKHSNNRDSCFSLFGKIHFCIVIGSEQLPPRPGLNTSRRLLGHRLDKRARRRAAAEREKKKEKKKGGSALVTVSFMFKNVWGNHP